MFKTIVWANDGSEPAEKALPLVKELTKEGGATVTIVRVVERVED
jgi:nucleotide-binding universal stress UspA family protein